MALTTNQQIFELIERSSDVLLAIPASPSVDALAASLALRAILIRLGKRVEVASDGFSPSERELFLPDVAAVRPHLPHLQTMIVEVDVGTTRLHELTHEVVDGTLRVHLTPHSGMWKPEDIRAKPADYRYALSIVLGSQDLESLGAIYSAHPEFFYRVPTINIDNHPANEHFGTINAVDVTATSVSEVVYDLFSHHRTHIDGSVATSLLAGIVSATKSFKTDNITPKVLSVTGELVAMGGRREDVVKHLFRTRGVPALRLWGRALARLKHDEPTGLVWSVVTSADFVSAGANDGELDGVADELISFCPEARAILILHETRDGVAGIIHTRKIHDARALARPFAPSGSRGIARFHIPETTLVDAERRVIATIKEALAASR